MVENLQKEDQDEILHVLNRSFSHGPTRYEDAHIADFGANLPAMWFGDPSRETCHLGIRENGKIQALLGVYPILTKIAGEEVLFCTIGNVATLPEARGKGLMKELMKAAITKAENLGIVAARLGGLRSRYNRWGFEHAGSIIHARFTQRNAAENVDFPELHLKELREEDRLGLSFARACHERKGFYCPRQPDIDFYYILKAWQCKPWLVYDEKEQPVGYLSVSPEGFTITDWGVDLGISPCQLSSAYLKEHPEIKEVTFEVQPTDLDGCEDVLKYAECWWEDSPSMFRIFQWDCLLSPLMKLASETRGLPDGCLKLEIKEWGTLEMKVESGVPTVHKVHSKPEMTISGLEATACLLGNSPKKILLPYSRPENAWFPLPLTWNGQDRV